MKEIITKIFNDTIELKKKTLDTQLEQIESAAQILIDAFQNKNKVLICGNGGSAADSQHFATELVSRFEKDRPALPAIALTTDTSELTATSNDFGFDAVFSRQVEALGNKNDVFIGISTSGNSKNIIKAIEVANKKEMRIITFLGRDGGLIKDMKTDCDIIVPGQVTARIQESHETIYHILCKLIEEKIF